MRRHTALAVLLAVLVFAFGQSLPTLRAQTAAWVPAAPMATGRDSHTSSILPDGRVLVTGGFVADVASAAVEIYDPASNTWTTGPSMSIARASHVAKVLGDGRVLVAGGIDASNQFSALAEIFDPSTTSWVPVPSMHYSRAVAASVLLSDGRVLVSGGYTQNANPFDAYTPTAEIFDPSANTWQDAAPMQIHRVAHMATLLTDGRVLVAGGANYAKFEETAEIYDPVSNVWTPVPSMSTQRYSAAASILPDGRVLVAGGQFLNFLSSAEIFNPATNHWSAASPMSVARGFLTATQLADGTVLVAGGWNGSAALDSSEVFDPVTGIWSTLVHLSSPRYSFGATLLHDGRVLVTGGSNGTSDVATADMWGMVPSSAVTVSAAHGPFGGSTDLTATLTGAGAAGSGRVLHFSVNGTSAGTAATDANGVATVSNVSLAGLGAGSYPGAVQVTFAGDVASAGSSGAGDLVVDKAVPAIAWTQPFDISYGTALDAAQLNATASVDGAFSYSPAAGAVLGVGAHALQVTFTPLDTTDYTTATATVGLTVFKSTVPGFAFVTDGTSAVSVVDLSTNTIIDTIGGLGSISYGIALAPDARHAYVTDRAGNHVYTINTLNDAVEASIPVGSGPRGIAVTPDGRTVYVANRDANSVSVIDTATNQVSRTITAGTLPEGVAIAPNGARVYLADNGASTVTIVDTATAQVTGTFNVGHNPGELVLAPDGSRLYVSSQSDARVTVVDTASGVVIATVPVVFNAHQLTISPDGARVYLTADQPGGSFGAVDTATNTVVPGYGLSVGAYARGLAVTPAGDRAVVAVAGSAAIAIVNLSTPSLVASIGVGGGATPVNVVITPVGRSGSSLTVPAVFAAPGQPITLSATLAGSAPVGGRALRFSVNHVGVGVATTDGVGTAVLALEPSIQLSTGSNDVQVDFDGDFTLQPSQATSTLVLKALPVITWPAPAPIVYGMPLGSAQLNATSNVPGTFAYSPGGGTVLPPGVQPLTVTFTPSDTQNYIAATASVQLDVAKASTTTSVHSLANPAVFGQAVTITATVSPVLPGAGAPTGLVVFMDGPFQIGSSAPLQPGAGASFASVTTAALAVRPHSITARYLGDGNFLTGNSAVFSQVVNPAATATTLISVSPNPSVYGQIVTLSANLSVVQPGAGIPTGTIVFFDGPTVVAAAIVPAGGGAITTTTNSIGLGSHSLTAQYFNDGNFLTSTSAPLPDVVKPAGTSVFVWGSPNPSGSNQPVTLTAIVAPISPGAGVPAGYVVFSEGSVTLGSASLVAGAGGQTATITAAFQGNGPTGTQHQIVASYYSSELRFLPSLGGFVQTAQGGPGSTTTTLTISKGANPAAAGTPLTVVATISNSKATGTVQILDGNILLATCLISGGQAQTTLGLAPGGHVLAARYSGDGSYAGSTSLPLLETIYSGAVPASTTTSLSLAPGVIAAGGTTTLSASIKSKNGLSGGVAFVIDGSIFATVPVVNDKNGATATLSLQGSVLGVGTHTISAVYLGDALDAGSVSAPGSLTIR